MLHADKGMSIPYKRRGGMDVSWREKISVALMTLVALFCGSGKVSVKFPVTAKGKRKCVFTFTVNM